MKRVHTASDLPMAHLLAQLLEHAGIKTFVFNENAVGGLGELAPDSAQPQVWVAENAQADRARTVIAAHLADNTHNTSVDRAHCGETNPRSFELCWHCGKDLGD